MMKMGDLRFMLKTRILWQYVKIKLQCWALNRKLKKLAGPTDVIY